MAENFPSLVLDGNNDVSLNTQGIENSLEVDNQNYSNNFKEKINNNFEQDSNNLQDDDYDPDVKFLTIGDPHFMIKNRKESKKMTDALIELAEREKPDFIVCLGDILDKHEKIHVKPLKWANEMLDGLRRKAPLYVIIGNHDRPNNSDYCSGNHPFTALHFWENTFVADKPIEATIKDMRFLFVPYVYPGKFETALNEYIKDWKPDDTNNSTKNNKRKVSTIFAHQEFYGCKMGAITSVNGDKWPLSNPLVVSGHIHDYQQIQPNIIYTGTPMQHAFGDREDKTVSIFTIGPSGHFDERRIDLNLTKKSIVYLHPTQVLDWKPDPTKEIKLVIKGTQAEIKAASKMARLKELKSEGLIKGYTFKLNKKSLKDSSESKNDDNSEIQVQESYLQSLFKEVIKNPDENLKMWFEEIFGGTINSDIIVEEKIEILDIL